MSPATATPNSSAEVKPERRRTYGEIIKSSALIGGSSLLNIGFSFIRTKAMALWLGPSGVGLFSLYNSVYDVVRSLAGLGIYNSGVRQIAEAVSSQDASRISRTVTILRRVAFGTGALGGLILLFFCRPISWLTFHDYQHAAPLAWLGLAVFFADVSAGQIALVQGMRRIADLATLSVLGAFTGTVLSIPIIYFFRERGIVPSLVMVAAMGIVFSWWYARKVKVEPVAVSWRELLGETSALLKMGFVFMASSMMTLCVAYLVRIILVQKLNLEAAGFYQAAWSLGGLYFGFILQAMGADFYPRLTAVAHNNTDCNRLVNEQAEIGLLLAGPGVLGTLTFAPLVIELFYSQKFGPAVEVLRWICLGMVLRVVSWPLGYILAAKGEAKLLFWTELLGNALQVVLIWFGVGFFALPGTGMGFFGLYIFYSVGIYFVVRRLSGFRWSPANRRLGGLLAVLVGIVFAAWYLFSHLVAGALGAAVTVVVGLYSLRTLCTLVPLDKLPKVLVKILRSIRLAR